jgi:hypothetical protein
LGYSIKAEGGLCLQGGLAYDLVNALDVMWEEGNL